MLSSSGVLSAHISTRVSCIDLLIQLSAKKQLKNLFFFKMFLTLSLIIKAVEPTADLK